MNYTQTKVQKYLMRRSVSPSIKFHVMPFQSCNFQRLVITYSPMATTESRMQRSDLTYYMETFGL
ncbi:hypothetical protein C480_04751 [Natrialba aegyptia DSM 13077]|uniref:Uncharacterized protein n=1 Tax=Natrialba aegyptia DSM 13077 TaxID=1227491 RepID=M0B8U7_9EURY|nr:hypothetical protein C480_04751 [Natrialba aegyptia DSM 13077]